MLELQIPYSLHYFQLFNTTIIQRTINEQQKHTNLGVTKKCFKQRFDSNLRQESAMTMFNRIHYPARPTQLHYSILSNIQNGNG